MPTEDEKAAMAGGGNFGTPSTSNKFLTEDYIPTVGPLLTTGVSKKIGTLADFSEIGDDTAGSEQTIISETLPGGLLSTNNAVRVRCLISNLTANARVITFRLKYGSTTIATLSSVGTIITDEMSGVLEGIIFANGSTSAQNGSLYIDTAETNLSSGVTMATNGGTYFRSATTGTATEDSTGDLTVSLTLEWVGSATASNDFVPAGVTMELIS